MRKPDEMRAAHAIDAMGVAGLALFGLGCGFRWGWDVAAIHVGAVLLLVSVLYVLLVRR